MQGYFSGLAPYIILLQYKSHTHTREIAGVQLVGRWSVLLAETRCSGGIAVSWNCAFRFSIREKKMHYLKSVIPPMKHICCLNTFAHSNSRIDTIYD